MPNRRHFLDDITTGLFGIGLAHLLTGGLGSAQETGSTPSDWQPGQGQTHFSPRARRVLQIFCPGTASHIDLWEHKPALDEWHGRPLPGAEGFVSFQGKNGNLMRSPWPFVRCGESGKAITSLLPRMGAHVDDIAFVHSLKSKSNTHGPGCIFMNTGHVQEGFPSAGAWASYALGSENHNLPTYVAMPDIRGEPPNGQANWSNGFLPAQHQAIVLSAGQPIRNLEQPTRIGADEEQATRELLARLNERHLQQHPGRTDLSARIDAYRLAAPCSCRPRKSAIWMQSHSRCIGCTEPTMPILSRLRMPATACLRGDCWNEECATSTCTARRGRRGSTGC